MNISERDNNVKRMSYVVVFVALDSSRYFVAHQEAN